MDWSESEVTLTLGLLTRDLLEARGFRVYLIRDADYALNPELLDVNEDGQVDHVDEMQARVDAVNALDADLLLSIHLNAFYWDTGVPAEDVGGSVTFYCAARPFGEDSLRFAQLVQRAVVAAFSAHGYEIFDRGVERDLVLQVEGEPGSHLILLGPKTDRIVRPSLVRGVLSEPLFLTNSQEAELARDLVMQERLARAYADAISAYFEKAIQTRE